MNYEEKLRNYLKKGVKSDSTVYKPEAQNMTSSLKDKGLECLNETMAVEIRNYKRLLENCLEIETPELNKYNLKQFLPNKKESPHADVLKKYNISSSVDFNKLIRCELPKKKFISNFCDDLSHIDDCPSDTSHTIKLDDLNKVRGKPMNHPHYFNMHSYMVESDSESVLTDSDEDEIKQLNKKLTNTKCYENTDQLRWHCIEYSNDKEYLDNCISKFLKFED